MNSRRSHSITSSARASRVGGTVEAERPGGLKVDDKLELGRLQDRQIGGLGALEDAAGIDADLTIGIRNIGSIAHQPAGFGIVANCVARGNRMARRLERQVGRAGCRRRGRDRRTERRAARARALRRLRRSRGWCWR